MRTGKAQGRRLRMALGALVAATLAAGCGEESGSPAKPDDEPIRVLSPDESVVADHLAALEARDAAAYAALLAVPGDHDVFDPGFRFHVRPGDEGSFPWLAQPWWSRAVEVGMMLHAFDPSYAGAPPAQSVQASYTVLNKTRTTDALGIAVTEITVDAAIELLTGPADGYAVDTRLVFAVGVDTAGRLRIREIREIWKLDPARAEPLSWGRLKAVYR